jgi:retron-type reverse transcriptase
MMHGREKSDPAIVAVKPTNKAGQPGAELVEPRAGTEGKAGQQSTRRAQNRESVSQALDRIRQAARQRKKERFTALFHHISLDLLRMAFLDLKRNAAPGVDGLTWQDYEADLDRNLTDLHDRVHRGAYRALPSRRRYIPKADGRQRPLAIAALEDKIVQRATVTVLNAIYEEDFLGFSYGFRPRRSQHDALDALVVGISSTKVNYILDADIAGFFDAVSQDWLVRFLNHRIGDPRMIRLIQKWLRAGILEDGVVTTSDRGTGQGSVASPLLANVYLHYVFDLWANRWRQREATGDMIIVRYADDVRHFTGRWIPFTERRGLEETTLGPTAYPAVKAKGDRSMPSKRERPEDADGRVPQGPRDKVRTALFEPQSPGMQAYIPRHSV